METKLCGNLPSCRRLFVELEHLDRNPQSILELFEQFSRKLTICVFHATWKAGKESKILGRSIKLYCPPHTWLRISVEFCVCLKPFARSVGPTVQKERKWNRKLDRASRNRMAGICYRKPTIITSYHHSFASWFVGKWLLFFTLSVHSPDLIVSIKINQYYDLLVKYVSK